TSTGMDQAPSRPAASSGGGVAGLTDEPIFPGEIVHIGVFGAPDFTVVTRVSESGDIAYPYLGILHFEGLNSAAAASLISTQLISRGLMRNPQVMVTVEATLTGITVLGEVREPGVYPPRGKHMLSDVLAAAGGLMTNAGRVIEISELSSPEKKIEIPWDPTMHNTANFDRPVRPGDRVIVRPCGVVYVGGHVSKPGAYSECGSRVTTLSQLIARAGGSTPFTATKHTLIVHLQPDGTKTVQEVDLKKVLTGRVADPVMREDDIIYVSPSPTKEAVNRAVAFVMSLVGPILYVYRP
ncbi:MAG TPA: SLBB domain-containing protein, partial [Terracidiphilus sp.]|nr:SLBB domain-containing protein [Terracidiphilus sp.]